MPSSTPTINEAYELWADAVMPSEGSGADDSVPGMNIDDSFCTSHADTDQTKK